MSLYYSGTEYYFNKESCLREWEDYLTNPKNGLKEHSSKLLQDLKILQASLSMEEFKQNVKNLSKCPIWKSDSTATFRQNWFAGSKVEYLIYLDEIAFWHCHQLWLMQRWQDFFIPPKLIIEIVNRADHPSKMFMILF